MVGLVPMTPEEFAEYQKWSIPDYAEAHVRAGQWDPEHALERSQQEHDRLLPKGLSTPDHYFWTLRDDQTGLRVGEIWYALQSEGGPPGLFIFWIGVRPDHRRKGYASAAISELGAHARELKANRISLHVFADNSPARDLYEKLGFRETNIIMAKSVPTT